MTRPTSQELAALHARCFTTPRPWSAAEFDALLKQASVLFLGDSDAFIVGQIARAEAEILTLCVAPKARRRGRALDLLSGLETKALGLDVSEIFLEVAADNKAAKALYMRHGYALIAERPGYYRRDNLAPVAALVMRKNLKPALARSPQDAR